MIVCVTGVNAFGRQQELDRLIGSFVAEHGDVALERLDCEEASFERMREALNSLPFLANKKMVMLRSPGANKQFAEAAEALLADVPETTDVLIVEPKLDKRLGYYKILKKLTDFKEFPQLDTNGLAQWLVGAARERQGSIGSNEARYLVERIGPNQQLLSNELDKLLLYDAKVTRANIDLLTEPTPQSTVFQLLEAAFGGRSKLALQLYNEQRAQKVEPQQIIAMLAWQLHILAIVKTAGDRRPEQIAKEARLSPYVVGKSAAIARQLSLARLKLLIKRLRDLDVKSKSSAINLDDALLHYLLSLSK